MAIIDRIKEWQNTEGISNYALEKKLELANGYLAKSKNPTSEVIEKIIRVYPNISTEWLIKGEGNMYIDNPEATAMNHSIAISGHNNNASLGDTAVLEERVKALEALLAEKERLIKVYEKMMDK